jgi:hypothetical protein
MIESAKISGFNKSPDFGKLRLLQLAKIGRAKKNEAARLDPA